MKNDEKKPQDAASLRQKAEERLKERLLNPEAPGPKVYTQRLIHELELRQVEFEIQNEELRASHEELLDSENRFREIFEHSPSGIAIYEIVDGGADFIVKDFSSAAERIMKIKKEDVIGKRVTSVFPGVIKFGLLEILKRVWKTGTAEYYPANIYTDGISPDRWFENWIYKLPNGNIVAMFNDVTERKTSDGKIRDRERVYSTLISNLPGFVYRCANDRKWTMQYMSDGCQKITGYKAEDFIGNKKLAFSDIVPSSYQELLWKKWQQILAHRAAFEEEYPIHTASGKIRWVWERGRGVFDDAGNLLFLEGYVEDITERKEADELLKKSNERFMMVSRATNDVVWDWDLKTDSIWWSEGMQSTFGHNADDIGSTIDSWADKIHPEDRDKVRSSRRSVLELCARIWTKEYRFRKADQSYAHVFDRGYIICDDDGKPMRMVGAMSDITDRKKAEEEVHTSEEKFRILYEFAPDAYFIYDIEGRCMDCNLKAEDILGLDKGVIKTKKFSELGFVPDTGSRGLPEILEKNRQGESTGPDVFRLKNADVNIILEVVTHPIMIHGLHAVLATARDITERKKAEMELRNAYKDLQKTQNELIQSEKMAAIGRFSSGIAHEVRNPLAVIVGCAELLENRIPRPDPDSLETFGKIKDAAFRANSVLQSLLQYARPSELKVETVDPADVIYGVLPIFENRARVANIAIVKEVDRTGILISVDKNQIHQVIFNIIKNALEAMGSGGRLTIRAYLGDILNTKGKDQTCVIEVEDTGPGISSENLKKLTEPFFSTKDRGSGAGLGLFMAKSILDKHHGKLIIESEEGKGTVAKICLPIASL